MGESRSNILFSMEINRQSIICMLVIVACAMAQEPEIDQKEAIMPKHVTETHEDVLLTARMKAQETVVRMKKKGATDADCKDLAITECKQIVSIRTNDIRLLRTLKSGRQCASLGQREVRIARARYVTTDRVWLLWKKKVTIARRASVTISSRSFDTIREDKCGFVFNSKSYTRAHLRFRKASKMELKWRGSVVETRKAWVMQVKIAQRKVKQCHCATKAARDKLWASLSNPSRIAKLTKDYAKCNMMQCVLNGTPHSSSKCRGHLKKLTRRRLYSVTEKISGCGRSRPKIMNMKTHWRWGRHKRVGRHLYRHYCLIRRGKKIRCYWRLAKRNAYKNKKPRPRIMDGGRGRYMEKRLKANKIKIIKRLKIKRLKIKRHERRNKAVKKEKGNKAVERKNKAVKKERRNKAIASRERVNKLTERKAKGSERNRKRGREKAAKFRRSREKQKKERGMKARERRGKAVEKRRKHVKERQNKALLRKREKRGKVFAERRAKAAKARAAAIERRGKQQRHEAQRKERSAKARARESRAKARERSIKAQKRAAAERRSKAIVKERTKKAEIAAKRRIASERRGKATARERRAKAVAKEKSAKERGAKVRQERAGKARERNTKRVERATKARERTGKATKERSTKAKEQQAKRAARAAAASAERTSKSIKARNCRQRVWNTNVWTFNIDCCKGCDGRSPAPGGMMGACTYRCKLGWARSRCQCKTTPRGAFNFQTARYYFGTDCCAGCRSGGAQCIRRNRGAFATSTCTCRLSC